MTSDISLSLDQLIAYSANQDRPDVRREDYFTIRTRSDYGLKCGDFVRETITRPMRIGRLDLFDGGEVVFHWSEEPTYILSIPAILPGSTARGRE